MQQGSHRAQPRREQNGVLDRLFFTAFLLSLVVIIFLAGALVTIAGIFPGPHINRAYEGGLALYRKLSEHNSIYSTDLWYPARSEARGVTRLLPDKVEPGATLYTSGESSRAYLVSLEGEVLHEWHLPFSEIHEEGSGIDNPQPDEFVYFRAAALYPNGDLVVVIEGSGDTPYGYAIARLSSESELQWVNFARTHHDLEISPDGRIYTLSHEIVQKEMQGYGHLDDAWLEDYLIVLSENGQMEKRIPLAETVADSPYKHLLHTVSSYSLGDPLHTNAVNRIDAEAAGQLPFADEGDLLLSFRELNAIAVLDPEREELVWATRGSWLGQHYPEALANGNILLFDNRGNYEVEEGVSRVIEFDPETQEIVWDYSGTPERPLDSHIRADQQRLANGNTLITESNSGRILEVTQDGEVAWEYLNPARGGEEEDYIAIVNLAQRITQEDLDPAFLTLPAHPEAPVPEENSQ